MKVFFLAALAVCGTAASAHLLIDASEVSSARSTLHGIELMRQADREAGQSATLRRLVGGSLLTTSREALARVITLSSALELEPKASWREALIREGDALATFADWTPGEFLATAEAMAALAIASESVPSRSGEWSRALVSKGLRPALDAIASGEDWTKRKNNWPQVIASSMILAALATEDGDANTSQKALVEARKLLATTDRFYAPDGLSPEGIDYWVYGVDFQAMAQRALRLKGQDGVFDHSVWSRAGWVLPALTGPSGRVYNIGDSSDEHLGSIALFEMAARANRPIWASWNRGRLQQELSNDRSPWRERRRLWGLVPFWSGRTPAVAGVSLPPGSLFEGETIVGTLRRGKTWLAFRAGQNGAPHSHLDAGSFVLEMGGVRWSVDLGSDAYDLPGYFNAGTSGKRWDYLRTSERGHSLMYFSDRRQAVHGRSKVAEWNPERLEATLNLGGIFATRSLKTWDRRFWIASDSRVVIEDDLGGLPDGIWQIIAPGQAVATGNTVTLTHQGQRLRLTAEQVPGAKWSAKALRTAHPGERKLPPVSAVQFSVPTGTPSVRVVLELLDN